MEKLKHSEEEILKLGKKLIAELELEYSVNTLARWMAHYIAELIHNIETSKSITKKTKLQKECCSLILEIWEKRERIPFEKPLQKLKPIIDVLDLLKKREHPFIAHRFFDRGLNTDKKDTSWLGFLKIVKENSESIYRKSLISLISDEVLNKDKEWIEKHGSFLSTEEKDIIAYLDSINEVTISFDDNTKKDDSQKAKAKKLFSDLEQQIEEQKIYLKRLKKEYLN